MNCIQKVFAQSPQFLSPQLSAMLELSVIVKDETKNPIGCFKGRGTALLLAALPEGETIVSASAGNFGQGLAYNAASRRQKLILFAPQSANSLKVKRMLDLGAEVRLAGEDFDAAKLIAKEYALNNNLRFVEDGKEPELSLGAGEIAAELLADQNLSQLDAVFAPLGNGSLLSGIGAVLKANVPHVKLIGVFAEGAPVMAQAVLGLPLVTSLPQTFCDGVAVRIPVPEALPLLKTTVDQLVGVSDQDVLTAMRLLHSEEGMLSEPSGALALAACQKMKRELKGKCAAVVITGANIRTEQKNEFFSGGRYGSA